MELIFKIGGDQQGLQQTVDRIKNQFKNMNVSTPMNWHPAMAARQQYGGIMTNATPDTSGLMNLVKGIPYVGPLAEKFQHLLGPVALVTSALGALGMATKEIGHAISQAAGDIRTGRITGMSGLMARRWRQAGEAAGVEGGDGMVSKLQAMVGNFNAGDSSAQKLFGEIGVNPAGMATDDLLLELKKKFGALKDPAARARLAKGLFGKGGFEVTEILNKLEAPGAADTEGMDMAAAAGLKKWWKSLKRTAGDAAESLFTRAAAVLARSRLAGALGIHPGEELKSGVAGAEGGDVAPADRGEASWKQLMADKAKYKSMGMGKSFIEQLLGDIKSGAVTAPEGEVTRLEAELIEEKKKNLDDWKKQNREARENTGDSRAAFTADTLAQAGLFTGSALLANPNLTIEQAQLDVLREISTNTRGREMFVK